MTLNYNFSKVENYKKKLRSKRLKAVLDMLIWITMFIGIREITEKNAKLFFARLHACEAVNGAYLYQNGKPKCITLKEVEAFIGLTTNANTMTASQFEKKYFMEK